MRAGDRLRRSGIGLQPHQTVRAAAEVMEASGVGAVVVIDGAHRPLGIVTDRDLVRRVLAAGLPGDARVDAVMSSPVVTIDADADAHEAFAVAGGHGVRRVVVVDDGRFVGLISLDDLLVELSEDLRLAGRAVALELHHPAHDAGLPARA